MSRRVMVRESCFSLVSQPAALKKNRTYESSLARAFHASGSAGGPRISETTAMPARIHTPSFTLLPKSHALMELPRRCKMTKTPANKTAWVSRARSRTGNAQARVGFHGTSSTMASKNQAKLRMPATASGRHRATTRNTGCSVISVAAITAVTAIIKGAYRPRSTGVGLRAPIWRSTFIAYRSLAQGAIFPIAEAESRHVDYCRRGFFRKMIVQKQSSCKVVNANKNRKITIQDPGVFGSPCNREAQALRTKVSSHAILFRHDCPRL